MVPIANPTRRRQSQYSFVDRARSRALFALTGTMNRLSDFLNRSGCVIVCRAHQPVLETALNACSIG
jgi:hypothetical protein